MRQATTELGSSKAGGQGMGLLLEEAARETSTDEPKTPNTAMERVGRNHTPGP